MNPKIKKRILYSILISLFIHLGFLVWSFFIRLIPSFIPPEKPPQTIHVKMLRQESVGQKMPDLNNMASSKASPSETPFVADRSDPLLDSIDNSPKSIESFTQKMDTPPVVLPVTPIPPSFKKSQINDNVLMKKANRPTRKNLVDVGDAPSVDPVLAPVVESDGAGASKDELDKSPYSLFASQVLPVRALSGANEFQAMKRSAEGLSQQSKAGDLGTSLTYELSTYQEPKTGQKYFKLLVKVRDATVLFPVIPKEIVFLLDASGSIGKPRLEQIKQGLRESLKHLNPKDHFNIIVFKDKTMYLSEESLTAEPVNIKKATDFIMDLLPGGKTDVYNAFAQSINMKVLYNPSYRLLLSDGFSTKGIIDSREMINKVSDLNDGKVCIFSFGGGVDVSRYMLDFVAYKNRGWSQVEDQEAFIGRELAKMYNRIKDPLLLKLRYHTSGLNNEDNIYPKVLPDFFKGAEFIIYGTYTNENKFVVQVLGDTTTETKEFMINASFQDAAVGNKEIVREWAFHKIYYLISRLKYKADNRDIIQQINELCAKYNIVTPYSKNF